MMKNNNNITINDVAKHVGVSITTVSLVLNNKISNISDKTVSKVISAADELGFKAKKNKHKIKKANKTVALIIPEADDVYYSRYIDIIEKNVSKRGYSLLTVLSRNDFDKEMSLIHKMAANHVDYLLILPSNFSLIDPRKKQQYIAELQNLLTNFVILDRHISLENHVEVLNDERYGSELITNYLINKGHTRIACITGPKGVYSNEERLAGYKNALKSNNIEIDESLIYYGDYMFNTAAKISRELLTRKDIDAIYAFNDSQAYAVYYICSKLGIKVGLDISVVGYDDCKFSSIINPMLTTVAQDFDSICRTAVDELFKHSTKGKMIKFKPRIVERNSVVLNDISSI